MAHRADTVELPAGRHHGERSRRISFAPASERRWRYPDSPRRCYGRQRTAVLSGAKHAAIGQHGQTPLPSCPGWISRSSSNVLAPARRTAANGCCPAGPPSQAQATSPPGPTPRAVKVGLASAAWWTGWGGSNVAPASVDVASRNRMMRTVHACLTPGQDEVSPLRPLSAESPDVRSRPFCPCSRHLNTPPLLTALGRVEGPARVGRRVKNTVRSASPVLEAQVRKTRPAESAASSGASMVSLASRAISAKSLRVGRHGDGRPSVVPAFDRSNRTSLRPFAGKVNPAGAAARHQGDQQTIFQPSRPECCLFDSCAVSCQIQKEGQIPKEFGGCTTGHWKTLSRMPNG